MSDLQAIFATLKAELQTYQPPLTARLDDDSRYDLWSEREVVIAGRKRKEVFFASVIIQKSYVGFYYMPVYTDAELKTVFAPELLRLLKGKSCFHIKKLDPGLLEQIRSALRIGFDLYRQKGWV